MIWCRIEDYNNALVSLIVRISEQSNKEMVDHIRNGYALVCNIMRQIESKAREKCNKNKRKA